MLSEKAYWLAFSTFPGIGPVRFSLLHSYFESAKHAWTATRSDLEKVGLPGNLVSEFELYRNSFSLEGYLEKLKQEEVYFVTLQEEKYPALLKEITDAPFVLYIKGKRIQKEIPWEKAIGVVGTRKVSTYGKEITTSIASELAEADILIVSGLALGVDALAHSSAMDAGGITIAVLGCGVDCCNPPSNKRIYDRIINGAGFVLSEMPLGHKPGKGLFPARNRIISGLSRGIVVTEGAIDSGSLITASYAAEQGRDVFAVPGPITSVYSKGPNELIKKGAKAVTSASDILQDIGITAKKRIKKSELESLNSEQQKLIELLQGGVRDFDEIVRTLKEDANKIASELSILELKGLIVQDKQGYQIKV